VAVRAEKVRDDSGNHRAGIEVTFRGGGGPLWGRAGLSRCRCSMDGDGRVGASAAAAPKALCAVGASSSCAAWAAALPWSDRIAGWPAARATGVSVLAHAPSAVGRARGGGLAASGLDRRRDGPGRRVFGGTRLQLSLASPRPAGVGWSGPGWPGRSCWCAGASPAAPDGRRWGCATAHRPGPAGDGLTVASPPRAEFAWRGLDSRRVFAGRRQKPHGIFAGEKEGEAGEVGAQHVGRAARDFSSKPGEWTVSHRTP
jgi:hypothetical protein